ncbi:MAG: acyl-CoA/acyl-ACP dehydrogenase [bacterium]|nr:acyl-CoA/acyl-ACP dehydrogenase [bacterium]
MDFILTREQKSMQKAAREFLKAECTSDFVRAMEADDIGCTPEFWRKMTQLDWMALTVPVQHEGVGGSLIDLVLMLEEMGRACVPGPFFSTVVLGITAIVECGSDSQQQELLPKIADGQLVLSLALTEVGTTRWNPNLITVDAAADSDGYVINGTKLFVADAQAADYIICAARTSGGRADPTGITLFLVDAGTAGIELKPLKTIGGDKQFEIGFKNVRVRFENILGQLDRGGAHLKRVLQVAAVGKCAEMVGGAARVLEMSSAYAKERQQFGKPIGSFQAVQHHCANMLIDLEGSRYITFKAAWMLDNRLVCDKEVAIAKAWVSEAYKKTAALGHQVQGGAAFMAEHDMTLYSRRAAAAAVTYGDPGYYREVIAGLIGL